MDSKSAFIVCSTSSLEGRSAPVSFRKCANNGSSTTLKSERCAKLYISAVLQLRGPDHKETFISLSKYRNVAVDDSRRQFVNRLHFQHKHVQTISHKITTGSNDSKTTSPQRFITIKW